jgi:hypothetical protein
MVCTDMADLLLGFGIRSVIDLRLAIVTSERMGTETALLLSCFRYTGLEW